MNSYPASEQRISEVERGQSCNAILPMPPGKTPSAGEFVLFALAHTQAGRETHYVKDGDSVCVLLTDVTDLGTTDPATGQALFRLSWKPLGQNGSPETVAKRVAEVLSPTHQEALMFPRYRHTPIFDSQRKRCPICNQSVYSLAGIHPQCAIKLDEGPQSPGNKEPVAEAEAPVLVEALVTQVATAGCQRITPCRPWLPLQRHQSSSLARSPPKPHIQGKDRRASSVRPQGSRSSGRSPTALARSCLAHRGPYNLEDAKGCPHFAEVSGIGAGPSHVRRL